MNQCIETVKKVTNKNINALQTIRDDNKVIQLKIRHIKELIHSKDPANAKNEEANKNFENSSMRSGGGVSFQGSAINEVQTNVNIFGALNTLNQHSGHA